MKDYVHVFVGTFKNRDDACAYTEPQWELETDEAISDEVYANWEDRNPTWLMRTDLGIYLDSDCIETIDGEDRYSYLGNLLTDCNAIERIRSMAGVRDNILVLIFSEALGGFKAEMKSTAILKYCGQYSCHL